MGRPKRSPATSHGRYTEEIVESGLLAMLMCGKRPKRAAELMQAQHGLEISDSTLVTWVKKTHRERFLELEAQHGPELERRLAQSKRSLLTKLAGGLEESVDRTLDALEAGDVKEPWKVSRDLAVVSGIETEKLLLLTDRPTQITEARSPEDMLRRLAEMGVVDGTAEEEPAELARGVKDAELAP